MLGIIGILYDKYHHIRSLPAHSPPSRATSPSVLTHPLSGTVLHNTFTFLDAKSLAVSQQATL